MKPAMPPLRAGKAAGEILPTPAAVTEADHDDADNDRDLQQGEDELKFARPLDPDVIQAGDQRCCGNATSWP